MRRIQGLSFSHFTNSSKLSSERDGLLEAIVLINEAFPFSSVMTSERKYLPLLLLSGGVFIMRTYAVAFHNKLNSGFHGLKRVQLSKMARLLTFGQE